MTTKYREKFGINVKNFTSTEVQIYPVKTLVTKGRCRRGPNKKDMIFRRAKCSCGAWKYSSIKENWSECAEMCKTGKCTGKCDKDVYGCRWAIWKDKDKKDPFKNSELFDEWVDLDKCSAH